MHGEWVIPLHTYEYTNLHGVWVIPLHAYKYTSSYGEWIIPSYAYESTSLHGVWMIPLHAYEFTSNLTTQHLMKHLLIHLQSKFSDHFDWPWTQTCISVKLVSIITIRLHILSLYYITLYYAKPILSFIWNSKNLSYGTHWYGFPGRSQPSLDTCWLTRRYYTCRFKFMIFILWHYVIPIVLISNYDPLLSSSLMHSLL